jgi:hypothetical protein
MFCHNVISCEITNVSEQHAGTGKHLANYTQNVEARKSIASASRDPLCLTRDETEKNPPQWRKRRKWVSVLRLWYTERGTGELSLALRIAVACDQQRDFPLWLQVSLWRQDKCRRPSQFTITDLPMQTSGYTSGFNSKISRNPSVYRRAPDSLSQLILSRIHFHVILQQWAGAVLNNGNTKSWKLYEKNQLEWQGHGRTFKSLPFHFNGSSWIKSTNSHSFHSQNTHRHIPHRLLRNHYPHTVSHKVYIWDLRFSRRWLWRMASSGMLRRVALVRTDVSKERSASFIRARRIGEIGTALAVTSNRRTLRRNITSLLGQHQIPLGISSQREGGATFLRKVGSYKSHTA